MKAYNGFSAAQRNKAQAWLNQQWASGKLDKPTQCCACRQTKGIIDAHAEDYSEPFAQGKTDQYHLCFRCHMMVHCRYANPQAFTRYRQEVYAGTQYAPFYKRDFFTFKEQQLVGWTAPVATHVLDSTDALGVIAGA